MAKSSTDDPIKKLLAEIAESVSALPEHLQQAAFTVLLNRALDSQQTNIPSSPTAKGIGGTSKTLKVLQVGSFGEYFHSFPAKMKEVERFLVASSFAETQSEDRTFTIESAHTLLKDIGVELSNAGVFAKQALQKKWAITVSKLGKKTFKYRVSLKGHNMLKEIKEQEK
jgi:hypothetical protein